jgi:hypothetical protein
VCGGAGCDASVCTVRSLCDGKNVRGDDGQSEQQQWKIPDVMHRERSVRWCVVLWVVVFRCRKRDSLDVNGIVVFLVE